MLEYHLTYICQIQYTNVNSLKWTLLNRQLIKVFVLLFVLLCAWKNFARTTYHGSVSVYVVFIGFICSVTSIDDDDIEFKIKGFPFFIQKLMYLIFQAIIIWWWSFRNAWNIIHVCAVMLKLLNRSFYFSRWFSTVFKLLSFHLSCSLALHSIEVFCPHTPKKSVKTV